MSITLQSVRDPLPAGALLAQLQANGTVLVYMPGDTLPPAPVPTLAELKAERIAAINAECRERILARWPIEQQITAAEGDYGDAKREEARAWRTSHIDASNVATSAVFDATTQQQMEAVTVAWPV